jgi:diadenosine tetraphosphate (Ap4A) HIT family hydrolase
LTGCVFCFENWANLDIVERYGWPAEDGKGNVAIINPLNPVTKGHVLVIHAVHTKDFTENNGIVPDLAGTASLYVMRRQLQANIITSIGPDATQTVMHTHLHIVPRRPNDGLPLPWSIQCKGCHGQPIVARGLCATCYKRWQRLPETEKMVKTGDIPPEMLKKVRG